MIRVVVVEDSQVVRELLVHILSSDPELSVAATAADGLEAVELVRSERPDVVTMDVNLPRMDGFEATKAIMASHPTPIVIVSGSVDTREVATVFRAIEAGAVAVLPRPVGERHPEYVEQAERLVETVKLMSEVRVVRRWRTQREGASREVVSGRTAPAGQSPKVIAIGASTGGPQVLQAMLKKIRGGFPIPILVVQHISAGFIEGVAQWLDRSTDLDVRVAADDEPLVPGTVYLGPDGSHLGVKRGGRIALESASTRNGMCPSVGHLFESVSMVYGSRSIGILLTGMGKDGAAELRQMRERGACTIAQDKESSIVHGMPGEAIRLNAADHVLSPDGIVSFLQSLSGAE